MTLEPEAPHTENDLNPRREPLSRRSFLEAGIASLAATAALPATSRAASPERRSKASPTHKPSSYIDLLRPPDSVTSYKSFEKSAPTGSERLTRAGEQWHSAGVSVETLVQNKSLAITLQSPSQPVAAVHLRWRAEVESGAKILGDAWERSYGDLGWRNIIPERVLPWYFAVSDGSATHGYGVQTGPRALCFWQVDQQGVSLWLNVCNGGDGVLLGERKLAMATVVTREGAAGEDSFTSVAALCHSLCSRPSRPAQPIYGANDWDYSYGHSTAASILRDTDFIAGLSPREGARPFIVIDEGWFHNTPAWPDMGVLAQQIKQRSARPGIWIRPLRVPAGTPRNLLLPDARFGAQQSSRAREQAFDPTVPEARERIHATLANLAGWGYEMVKHDFSTYDLLGQWGSEMGPQPTLPGWSLYDKSLTNAEAVAQLYALIREAVGPRVVLDGCNTIGHISQGIFDIQRTGDDTSGHAWERTRRMGINTLAFRLPQNKAFFTIDADLVGITNAVPWELNRQFLDALARSGSATLVSIAPDQRGPEQQTALLEAFHIAASGGTGARPADWMDTSVPERWSPASANAETPATRYRWSGDDGTSPFPS